MVVCVQRLVFLIYESWYIVESLYGAEYGNWRLAADIRSPGKKAGTGRLMME